MECANVSPPPSKKPKLSPASIDELPDSLLAKIFAYLPFKDRHQLCFVSSIWAAASRIPWSDVSFICLSTIPSAMVDSILGLCQMLQEVCAKDATINLESKPNLPICANVHTIKLRKVKFAVKQLCCIKRIHGRLNELFREYFSRFPNLTELTWQDVTCINTTPACSAENGRSGGQFVSLPSLTAASIRQLTLVNSNDPPCDETSIYLSLHGLTNLECFYSHDKHSSSLTSFHTFDLPNLREVCFTGALFTIEAITKALTGDKYPKLEVLILASPIWLRHEQISQLLQSCSGLRILSIAGRDLSLAHYGLQIPVTLPAPALRDRSTVQQPLEIFVGGDITKRVRFTLPQTSESANFWCIDCPLPEFLAKPEVAKVFKDVWVAEVIRDAPANEILPWASTYEMELFYSTSPLQFG